jgi:hypothetical protein
VQPEALVTVKVYVPDGMPAIFELVPIPVVVIPPGVLVKVHVPEGGKPLRTTLPVATEQVGWVTVPTTGIAGVAGCSAMTTLFDIAEMHPEALVTVKV